jgi:hypothetical protein
MITFVVVNSDGYQPRANVCLDSIKKWYPEAVIRHEVFNGKENTSYVEGLARRRLEIIKDVISNHKHINDVAIMLGADCVLYDRLPYTATSSSLVLVPHVITPPSRGTTPGLYGTGHANGDFVAFRGLNTNIVDWMLAQDIREDVHSGYFYEQTLLSVTPFIFDDVTILRDERVNVAYFNKHERLLDFENGRYIVNNIPLAMFQFSGYLPGRLSKYYGGPVLGAWKQILDEYEAAICGR